MVFMSEPDVISEDDVLSERISVAVSPALLRRIDDWRRGQLALPARGVAFRQLIELGLEKAA